MPASSITRLQTPLQQLFLKRLSANFRPVGKVGEVRHGQRAFRARLLNTCGIVLTEVNIKDAPTHTIEISQEAGTSFASTGATPASGSISDPLAWTALAYASAGLKTITASSAGGAIGTREVLVP